MTAEAASAVMHPATEAEVEVLARAAHERLGVDALVEIGVVADIVYGAVDSLESVGVLLDRRTGVVEVMRSAMSLSQYVWAAQRGFALHAPNRLVIKKVHQPDAAVGVLRAAFDARYIRAELQRVAGPPPRPLTLELDWPQSALLVEGLRHADAFDYEVNPA